MKRTLLPALGGLTLMALSALPTLANPIYLTNNPAWNYYQLLLQQQQQQQQASAGVPLPVTPSASGNPWMNYNQVQAWQQRQANNPPRNTNGRCTTGAIIGAVLGGLTGYGASKPDAYGWAIPAGAVAGGAAGCLINR
jgi:uncharacterized protein YcfJ